MLFSYLGFQTAHREHTILSQAHCVTLTVPCPFLVHDPSVYVVRRMLTMGALGELVAVLVREIWGSVRGGRWGHASHLLAQPSPRKCLDMFLL